MTEDQKKVCLENIKNYLDAIWALQNGKPIPGIKCDLCEALFFDSESGKSCSRCPLGTTRYNCCLGEGDGGTIGSFRVFKLTPYEVLNNPDETIRKLETRLKWLLKKYKQAGLDIEIE